MRTKGLVLKEVCKDSFAFEVNPDDNYSWLAPTLYANVHGHKGGIVNFRINSQCFNITIHELRQIVKRWEKIKKALDNSTETAKLIK